MKPDGLGLVSFTGLIFSPDGTQNDRSNVTGSIKVFSVSAIDEVQLSCVFGLPPANAPPRQLEIPNSLANSEDGLSLYVCGNLSNQLHEIDALTANTLRSFAVGAAPDDVVLVEGEAYVSNWAERRPGPQVEARSSASIPYDISRAKAPSASSGWIERSSKSSAYTPAFWLFRHSRLTTSHTDRSG